MNTTDLRFRQIHLDFHTSEHIAAIGQEFDPEEFADTLEKARVNSITCFARCHHGWIYYDTKTHPERRHPHLTRDLLKEQIEACQARGIRVPIYTTIQWDHYSASQHPEWLVVDKGGAPTGTPLNEAGFYRTLCVNSPYLDFLKAHVQEILERLPSDGFFFDIVGPRDCACKYCRALMEAEGIDFTDDIQRKAFARRTIDSFRLEMSRFVRQFNPEASLFYNQGHVGPEHRPAAEAYTHFELESLPSGGWGYLHFPMTVRYARNLGRACLGMTGKFHTSWGDFHSFKNPAALQYECFRMLASGARCSIGDQLAPSGKIDRHVYALVGSVYSQVEAKEPWCLGATPVTEIGVFTPEEFYGAQIGGLPPALMGATRLLEEGAHQFDVLDSASDLSRYKVLVLPDQIPVEPGFAARLEAYLAGGGALLASFASGMDRDQGEFTLAALGVSLQGEGPRVLNGELARGRHFERGDYAEYVLPKGQIGKGLPETEHVMYMRGMEVAAQAGNEVLVENVLPYFDRTHRHFCSHRQTPSSGKAGSPAVVRNDRAIYFSHPIFSQYNQNAPRWCKTMVLNALEILLPEPLVRHSGPSSLQVAVIEQAAEQRWVLHFLHYIPERRGQEFDVIEDVIPLYGVKVWVRAAQQVKAVQLAPEGEALAYEQQGNSLTFVLAELAGHQMVALQFA